MGMRKYTNAEMQTMRNGIPLMDNMEKMINPFKDATYSINTMNGKAKKVDNLINAIQQLRFAIYDDIRYSEKL